MPHKRQRGDHSGTASIPWLFDHYAIESNTHCFRLISGFFHGWLLCLSRASLSSTYYYVVFLWAPHFCVKLIVLITGGGLNPAYKWLWFVHFMLRLVLLLLFKCISSSFWACLLGTPSWYRLKIVFFAPPITQITHWTALALQIFAVCEDYARKPDSVEITVSLLGQSLPANHEK